MPREKKGFIANEIELERDVQNKLLEWKKSAMKPYCRWKVPDRWEKHTRSGSLHTEITAR